MAEKEPLIVIKKINVQAAGAHGGSWKVAFADFMTAMMAFFLVMWLLAQSEEVKKDVADYFSTPSIIEYSFSNYGVELTLEKLFLDLINEPLKFFQAFMKPADYTPDVMAMGSKKIVLHHMADKLGDVAQNVEVNDNEISFEIPADKIFFTGTGKPNSEFVDVMDKVKGVTSGLEESNVYIDSNIWHQSVKGSNPELSKNVAQRRLDLISKKVEADLEHDDVDIFGKVNSRKKADHKGGKKPVGNIKFIIKHKANLQDREGRSFDTLFGEEDKSMGVYDNFVNQLSKAPSKE